MLHLTPNAISRIQTLRVREQNPNLKLRVYIHGGGCSGFQYGYAFEGYEGTQLSEDDFVIDVEGGESVIVDAMSMTYLEGAVIDYVSNLRGANFKVNNPQAKSTCSCGSSFSLGDEPVVGEKTDESER